MEQISATEAPQLGKSLQVGYILGQKTKSHVRKLFFKTQFNVVLYLLRSPFPLRFHTETLHTFLSSLIRATLPVHLIFINCVTLTKVLIVAKNIFMSSLSSAMSKMWPLYIVNAVSDII
jgi:hypothetical protein